MVSVLENHKNFLLCARAEGYGAGLKLTTTLRSFRARQVEQPAREIAHAVEGASQDDRVVHNLIEKEVVVKRTNHDEETPIG